jgi:hypothetical protein
LIRCRGLVTNPNEFSAGDGAMRVLTNWMLTRPNLLQSRRGVAKYGSANGAAISKIYNYDDVFVFHSHSTSVKKNNGGTITAYSTPIAPRSGRMRCCIANKNLYIAGPEPLRLSAHTGTPTAAGGLVPPGIDRSALTYSYGGTVLLTNKATAYRYVFGFTDAKDNLILGEPSGRFVVKNTSGVTVNPILPLRIPSTATTSHFIKLYRTKAVAVDVDPGDDMQLVYERQLKATDISSGALSVTDICPDTMRGEFLYTGEAQEGLDQANNRPPSCLDVAAWDSRAWYANTIQPGELVLQLLATGGSTGLVAGDILQFAGGLSSPFALTAVGDVLANTVQRTAGVVTVTTATNHGYSTNDQVWLDIGTADYASGPHTITVTGGTTFTYPESSGSVAAITSRRYNKVLSNGQFVVCTTGTASVNIEATALNLATAINKHSSNIEVWATYVGEPQSLSGLGAVRVRGRTPENQSFSVLAGPGSTRACWNPDLQPYLGGVTWTLQRAANVTTATISAGTHALRVGETVALTNPSGTFLAGGTIASVSSTTFTYADTGANAGPTAGFFFNVTPTDTAESELDVRPNRLYFSKSEEPEAVPQENYIDCGSPDSDIIAIVPQGRHLFVIKEDEAGRVLGTDGDYRYERFEVSIRSSAPETWVPFAGRVWGWTNRGVVAISEAGIEPMSGVIDGDLLAVIAQQTGDAFAVPYESEGLYLLFLPDDVDLESAAGACKTAYAYVLETKTWGKWDFGANNGKRCGVVGATDDKLYFGDQYNGLTLDSYFWQERKALTAADLIDTTGASSGTATRAISKTATWVLQTSDAPSREKRWDELEVLFVSGQADFNMALANEHAGVAAFEVESQGTQTARVWVPADVGRGTRLLVTLTHAVASEACEIAGLAIRAEVLDGGPTR